jgi:hypothetical protein
MGERGEEGGTMTDPNTTTFADESLPDSEPVLEPTPEEINAWAERERARRQAWLAGPNEDERAQYAAHLRQRRLAETFDEGEAMLQERMRQGLRYGRDAQLATEGAISLFFRWSQRTFAELVKAGRDWEEETNLPRIARRVRMDDDKS